MADPTVAFKIDDVDMDAVYGLKFGTVTGLWDAPVVTLTEQAIYQREGVELMDDEPTTPAVDFVVTATIVGSDQGDFESQLRAAKVFLGPRGAVDHALVFGNRPDQQWIARFMGAVASPAPPVMIQRKVPVELHFRALSALAEDTTDQVVTAAEATPAPIPLGTERCRGTTSTTLSGSVSSVTFTYKNHAGTPIGSITVTHPFVNADVVAVDHDDLSIWVNGDRHDEYLSDGSFFRFDPRDGNASAAEWPTVEVDHGALTVTYRRKW
jgi:hypothetical protein